MKRDYYAVLGVAVAAGPAQIRRAYQRLARQYSPDVNLWDGEAQHIFEEIVEAYRVLGDPVARALYDRHGDSGTTRASGRRPRAGGRRGDDIHAPVEIAFAHAVSGTALHLSIERLSPCEDCGARGTRPGAPLERCSHCEGAGSVWRGEPVPHPERCPACEGTGERVVDPCPRCRGRGVRPAPATVHAVLPPGMDNGAQLRVTGEGHAGPFGGPRGDVIIITRVAEDPLLVRKGDNLHCELTISIADAVLGARLAVPTTLGDVDLVIPPGTQPGHVLRVRGKGMPRLAAEGRGDLHVTVRVEVPRGIDARTQELFREIGRVLPARPRVELRRSERS